MHKPALFDKLVREEKMGADRGSKPSKATTRASKAHHTSSKHAAHERKGGGSSRGRDRRMAPSKRDGAFETGGQEED